MHASARGRGPTFAAKLAAAGASVFLLRSLSEGAKLVISGSRYALMHPEAPAISSEAFSDIDGGEVESSRRVHAGYYYKFNVNTREYVRIPESEGASVLGLWKGKLVYATCKDLELARSRDQ